MEESAMSKALLIHIPHSSLYIPEAERNAILLDDRDLDLELLKMTDRYTDELFDVPEAVVHKNIYSRTVFDPERFRSDREESMSAFGMGAIYTHGESGKLLRDITGDGREDMLKKYYDPYHHALEEKVQSILDSHGKCLIIDAHSFPSFPLSFEQDKNPDRPDICIGTSQFHTPAKLAGYVEDRVRANKMSVERDFPFAGTMVPIKYYLKDKRVCSVMVEVNRKLYMDEKSGEKLPGFENMKAFIISLASGMYEEC